MKQVLFSAIVAAMLAPILASAVSAGPISRACVTSGRQAANSRLCGCIQSVADAALSTSDQRLAARFFRDPHMAQEIRQSDRAHHESFWKRYKLFGTKAEQLCARY